MATPARSDPDPEVLPQRVVVAGGHAGERAALRAALEHSGYTVVEQAGDAANDALAVSTERAGDAGAPEPVVPLRELERRAIDHALRATRGRVAAAAKLLGIGRATLYRRLATLDEAPGSDAAEQPWP
jgi:transcriptional regulator of acetoin/glycerol metabolism